LVHAYQAVNIVLGEKTWEFYVEQEKQEYEEREKQ
jgi:hypothetical protein